MSSLWKNALGKTIDYEVCFILSKQIFSYIMLVWIAQISFISILFIFLVHHLLMFFKSTLTVPKIKDLVNSPNQKYKDIYDTLLHKTEYTNIDILPNDDFVSSNIEETPNMKDELKSFLKKQLNNGGGGDTIMGIESISNNSFSNI
jgi:hypothetical protein